ncbi:hypothetical protein TVAG_069310 [Trichomonas vaginalis G3]|uniref:Uncharacterized protein n=1 Tax=Trichomonas vaginalis (strain ATCC PRA-98 / G3) TaxID=412133 RepID=A2EL86_TRIV3|nr:armadillo (ARM) repeat-containing protein family [Trichomonas vaginalis G3]EAY06563.1 hypothetical protein TVAG_069310 [Trichomonas vaginalis G3]KAI5538821.1 armadillo (ARM) repeat-containing protein family [Trichomonas vaginalis G3]|eukprot:XP_001318786.1 hypothetical protein [Trichomonas vaginalis G3]
MNDYKKEENTESKDIEKEGKIDNNIQSDSEIKRIRIEELVNFLKCSENLQETTEALQALCDILISDSSIKIDSKTWNFTEKLEIIVQSFYESGLEWIIPLRTLINWQFIMNEDTKISFEFFQFIIGILKDVSTSYNTENTNFYFNLLIKFVDNAMTDNPELINCFSEDYQDFLQFLTNQYLGIPDNTVRSAITSIFTSLSYINDASLDINCSMNFVSAMFDTCTIGNISSLLAIESFMKSSDFILEFSKANFFFPMVNTLVFTDDVIQCMIDIVTIMIRSQIEEALEIMKNYDPVYSLLLANSSNSCFPKIEYVKMVAWYLKAMEKFEIQTSFLTFFQENFINKDTPYALFCKLIKLLDAILDSYENSPEDIQVIVSYEIVNKIIEFIDAENLKLAKICVRILCKVVNAGLKLSSLIRTETKLPLDPKLTVYFDFHQFAVILDSEDFDSIMGELIEDCDDEEFIEECNFFHDKCEELMEAHPFLIQFDKDGFLDIGMPEEEMYEPDVFSFS